MRDDRHLFASSDLGVAGVVQRIDQHTCRHYEVSSPDSALFLRVDRNNRQVYLAGRPLNLTRLEFDLLRVLSEHPDEVCTVPFLIREVWGHTWFGGTHFLETQIGRLRIKLGESAREPTYIQTERGVGYRFSTGAVQHHAHSLVFDDELTLVSVRPTHTAVLGWPIEAIIGTFFLLSEHPLVGANPQIVVEWLQSMLASGSRYGPVMLPASDFQGDRHVTSAMLCLHSRQDGRFAGLVVHLLLDGGRAALEGMWPEGADAARCVHSA